MTRALEESQTCEKNFYCRYREVREAAVKFMKCATALQWRHNGRDSVSNHQSHHHFLNRLFRCRSKKTSKLRVTGLCAGNSPGTGEFPAQMASNAENVSIWWRHHGFHCYFVLIIAIVYCWMAWFIYQCALGLLYLHWGNGTYHPA